MADTMERFATGMVGTLVVVLYWFIGAVIAAYPNDLDAVGVGPLESAMWGIVAAAFTVIVAVSIYLFGVFLTEAVPFVLGAAYDKIEAGRRRFSERLENWQAS